MTATPRETSTPATTTTPGGPVQVSYAYDGLGRLIEANYSNGDYYHYTYDSVGNRLSQTTQEGTINYTYDDANRLTSVDNVTYTWDNNGNLLSDGANTYTYDRANRLISVTGASGTTTYAYDGLGNRYQQTSNGVTTTYVLDIAAGLTQVLSDGTNEYLYGNVESSLGTGETIYGFDAEQTDETGMVFLRARYYGSLNGDFLSRDSWQGDYNRPLSLNKWNYVEGNPVNYVDPTGYIAQTEADGANKIVNDLKILGVNIKVDWGYSQFPILRYLTNPPIKLECTWKTGLWTLDDLTQVQIAVHIVSGGVYELGGNFQSLFGIATIRRERGNGSTTDPSLIHYRVDGQDKFYKRYAMIHEMGHQVMYADMKTLTFFMKKLGSNCSNGIISNGYPWCLNSGKNHVGKYEPGDPQHLVSLYAGAGNFEDYAETFREVVVKAYLDLGSSTPFYNEAHEIYTHYLDNHDIGLRRTLMEAIINGNWTNFSQINPGIRR